MMSRRDAIRSYRRQRRRAFGPMRCEFQLRELGRCGDQLQDVYARHLPIRAWPAEVVGALTTGQIQTLVQNVEDELPW